MVNALVIRLSDNADHDNGSNHLEDQEDRESTFFREFTGIKPIESIDAIRPDDTDDKQLRNAIRLVTQSGRAYKTLPDNMRNNKEVLCALVYSHPQFVRVLKGSEKTDRDILWHALERSPGSIYQMDSSVLNDHVMLVFAFLKSVERNVRLDPHVFYSKDIEFFKMIGRKATDFFAHEHYKTKAALEQLARAIPYSNFFEDDEIASMYFEHVRVASVQEIYNAHLSDNSKQQGLILKCLADKNLIRTGELNIPESVWSDRKAMATLLEHHGKLFSEVSPLLRSDGGFVTDAIRLNSHCNDSIYAIVNGICGPLRTIPAEFFANVVKPLGDYITSRASISKDLFDSYQGFFSCKVFAMDCISHFMKKQPSLLIQFLSYPVMETFLEDLKNVSDVCALTTCTIYDQELDANLTRVLLSRVGGRVDVYTAHTMLFIDDRRHTRSRAESAVKVVRAMQPQLRCDLIAAIESIGDRQSTVLQDSVSDVCQYVCREPENYELAVKSMARDILLKLSIGKGPVWKSHMVNYLLEDVTYLQKEKRIAAFVKSGNNIYSRLEDTSIFSSSAYLRSLMYKYDTKDTPDVYKNHATQAERDDPFMFLSFMKEDSWFARKMTYVANDIVKQHPSVIRQSILLFGEGLFLADGTVADLPGSISWTVEKRLLQIAYKNHNWRDNTAGHIVFLRSFYYDLFEFDATEAERSTPALLPKRGKMPARYKEVLPQQDITTIGGRLERSKMINAWSNAVSEISRGLKMVESRNGKSKTTTVNTIDDGDSEASVTITKLCDKINNFLCRTTGQAQVMDMICDMFDVEDHGGDEFFQAQQRTAIDTCKQLNKKKRKLPVPHTSHGRGKKSSGVSTSVLLPSDDEDDI